MEEKLYLRPAVEQDMELLYRWANEPEVRANSFHTEPIPWPDHEAWFQRMLGDKDVRIYILMEGETPVGQVRVVKEEAWMVSYSVAAPYRGQGYGKSLLRLVENELVRVGGHAGDALMGEVKTVNVASQMVFEKLGYRRLENGENEKIRYRKSVGKEF